MFEVKLIKFIFPDSDQVFGFPEEIGVIRARDLIEATKSGESWINQDWTHSYSLTEL